MSDMNRGNLKPNVIFPELQEVIKQQDEQIKELEGLLSGSKMMNDEAIEQMQQKDQRIEELEKAIRLAIKCNDEGKKVELHTILKQALNK